MIALKFLFHLILCTEKINNGGNSITVCDYFSDWLSEDSSGNVSKHFTVIFYDEELCIRHGRYIFFCSTSCYTVHYVTRINPGKSEDGRPLEKSLHFRRFPGSWRFHPGSSWWSMGMQDSSWLLSSARFFLLIRIDERRNWFVAQDTFPTG